MYPLFSSIATSSPGNFYAVVETLSRSHDVSIVALSKNYIAMYGADTNEEGASLQLFNLQFKVAQSRLQFKLFSEVSKLWALNNSLLLTIGQNLAVVPYSLATEQLSALVGSHKLTAIADDDDLAIVTEVMVGNWEENNEIPQTNGYSIADKLKFDITSYINEGWSESAISQQILPKLIEKKDVDSIIEYITHFIDIPDAILVMLISFCISVNNLHIEDGNILKDGLSVECSKLLDKLLAVSYNDSILMPYLRSGLKFDDVLILLQYLCYMLSSNHILPGLNVTESESKVVDWGCLLIDSHYQQFLLLRDVKIKETLDHFKELVDEYILCLDSFKQLEPFVSRLKRGKCEAKVFGNDLYSIEKINLY